jgi:hypothetical protein
MSLKDKISEKLNSKVLKLLNDKLKIEKNEIDGEYIDYKEEPKLKFIVQVAAITILLPMLMAILGAIDNLIIGDNKK